MRLAVIDHPTQPWLGFQHASSGPTCVPLIPLKLKNKRDLMKAGFGVVENAVSSDDYTHGNKVIHKEFGNPYSYLTMSKGTTNGTDVWGIEISGNTFGVLSLHEAFLIETSIPEISFSGQLKPSDVMKDKAETMEARAATLEGEAAGWRERAQEIRSLLPGSQEETPSP